MKGLIVLLFLITICAQARVEEFAGYIPEAQTLVEARIYLKEVRDLLVDGGQLPREDLVELEREIADIARNGCDCPNENNIIRAQAYALIGTINGVISKETKSIGHGKKSYDHLVRAREIDPRNEDAIRGQGEALKAILKQGFFARNVVAVALGVNLRRETKLLIKDLKTFEDNRILIRLAEQLSELV